MPIDSTEFGAITVDGKTYEHDVIIRLSGEVEKRRKKLSKEQYGTSHVISKAEAKFVLEKGCDLLVVGGRPGRERSPVAGGERLFRQETLSGRAAADPRRHPDLQPVARQENRAHARDLLTKIRRARAWAPPPEPPAALARLCEVMLADQANGARLRALLAVLLDEADFRTDAQAGEAAVEHSIAMKIDFAAVRRLDEAAIVSWAFATS